MNKEKKENRGAARKLLIVIGVLLILFGAGYTAYNYFGEKQAVQDEGFSTTTPAEPEELSNSDGKPIKNPIDFKSLQKGNEEIYAWIKVPGTKVNYPIVQSAVDNSFYLKHAAEDKSWSASGAIYTELCNTRSFNDRVTLIYGHNGYSDTMFTTLHYFEKKDFFDKYKYFYIYTPSSRLTYRIVSAFKYDDRHIMNSFDFQDNTVFGSFIDMIRDPVSTNKNVAENLNFNFTNSSKIVVLSTCITHQENNRYLVCGVLVKDEKTN